MPARRYPDFADASAAGSSKPRVVANKGEKAVISELAALFAMDAEGKADEVQRKFESGPFRKDKWTAELLLERVNKAIALAKRAKGKERAPEAMEGMEDLR